MKHNPALGHLTSKLRLEIGPRLRDLWKQFHTQFNCYYIFRNCSTVEDLNSYQKLMQKIFTMTQEKFIKETNCQVPCSRKEYTLQREADDYQFKKKEVEPGYGYLGLSMKDGTVMVSHEVPIYNGNDMLSDFGGMLGLLLGASVLSVFECGTELLLTKISKINFEAK